MLKIITATALLVILAAPAQAETDVTKRCGTELTWKGVKCALAIGRARRHDKDAAVYEESAKHAEIDGDKETAEEMRRRAAYERARGESNRKLYPLQKQ